MQTNEKTGNHLDLIAAVFKDDVIVVIFDDDNDDDNDAAVVFAVVVVGWEHNHIFLFSYH